jgi:hypothetical protein
LDGAWGSVSNGKRGLFMTVFFFFAALLLGIFGSGEFELLALIPLLIPFF